MRKILFRGKSLRNGEWVYGYYFVIFKSRHFVRTSTNDDLQVLDIQVEPETVGQFTGLLDKKGNKIYDGDVVTDGDIHYEIYFDEEDMCYMGYSPKHSQWVSITFLSSSEHSKVIGNIHDNKEMLK